MVVGDTYLLSAATVCRCVSQVTAALIELALTYIKMPSVEALPHVKERFYEIASKFSLLHFIWLFFGLCLLHLVGFTCIFG